MLWNPGIRRSDGGEASSEEGDRGAWSPGGGRVAAQVVAGAEMSGVMTMEKGPGGLVIRRWSRNFGGHHFYLEDFLSCHQALRTTEADAL